jgi:hypothetical protein
MVGTLAEGAARGAALPVHGSMSGYRLKLPHTTPVGGARMVGRVGGGRPAPRRRRSGIPPYLGDIQGG